MVARADLNGRVFGSWTVLGYSHTKTHAYWLCRCVCGVEKTIPQTHLTRGNSKSCGCTQPKRGDRVQWRGYGEISADYWADITRRSKATPGRPARVVDVTIQEAWAKYQEQGGKCALTGLPIHFPETHRGEKTASLDRIDSSKGYTKGNIQWVHKDINIMKNKFNQDYFIQMCKLVSGACEIITT